MRGRNTSIGLLIAVSAAWLVPLWYVGNTGYGTNGETGSGKILTIAVHAARAMEYQQRRTPRRIEELAPFLVEPAMCSQVLTQVRIEVGTNNSVVLVHVGADCVWATSDDLRRRLAPDYPGALTPQVKP